MFEIFSDMLSVAVERNASDIYLRAHNHQMTVGMLTAQGYLKRPALPIEVGRSLIRFVKYEAHLDLAECRRPQAGHWTVKVKKQTVHLRVSTVGDYTLAETMVIRVIYPLQHIEAYLQQNEAIQTFGERMRHNTGLWVIGGAMGAGKSTTLAYLVQHFLADRVVLSIEDPVEIMQPAVLQLQVNEQAGMTYAQLFKLALRHHPQVIVIGEIRDAQTAAQVIEAALSGHLILTTIHALGLDELRQRFLNLGITAGDLNQALTGQAFQTRQGQHLQFRYQFLKEKV
ncbi:competence protein ComG [Weissella viridescens]|uniref:Competence protein ComG n=1 Tax=Weissella viridescens TaxID=1629 RepID=A0A3P2RB86_WEIVI|nr:ATPase, T2SS/T4P/T4SS family [Weissella viridescens]RRG18009.1 competence protein ComG [Weissella viridescens]